MPDKDASLMARCPECDSRIYFERRPDAGQIIVCPECETSLEIISANPVRLDWVDDEGERGSGGGFSGDPFAGFDDEDEEEYADVRDEDDEDEY